MTRRQAPAPGTSRRSLRRPLLASAALGALASALLLPRAATAQPEVLAPPPPATGMPAPMPDAVPPPPLPPAPVPPMPAPLAPTLAAPVPPAPPPVTDTFGGPLAGWSDGTPFLRSPDNLFILFPSGRLQVDTYVFSSGNPRPPLPNNAFLVRRARLETTGWIGPVVYFYIGGDFALGPPAAADPVAPSNLATTDDFVALAFYKNLFTLQMGQYDAPFTLENRMSDKYFDFMERSIAVRAFGIPENKEVGPMLTGYNDDRNFYYSLGIYDGDGQNFRNVDNNFDWMGRGWIAPFSFAGPPQLHDAEIGMSFWTGNRTNDLPLPTQSTQGGFRFLNNAFSYAPTGGAASIPVELHQQGRMNALAWEINVPWDHKLGVRNEWVWKHMPLSSVDVTKPTAPVILGGLNLKGWAMYAEGFYWLFGDDRILGDIQGIQPFTRLKKFGVRPPQSGLMLALKFGYLNENIDEESDAASLNMKDPMVGKTIVYDYELGINYWHSKRFRATFNYILNHFAGDTSFIKGLKSKYENEFLFRLAIAL